MAIEAPRQTSHARMTLRGRLANPVSRSQRPLKGRELVVPHNAAGTVPGRQQIRNQRTHVHPRRKPWRKVFR